MRVALIAPLYEHVPPALYGGTERVVASLAHGLASIGQPATIFAAGGSCSPHAVRFARDRPLWSDGSENVSGVAAHIVYMKQLLRVANEFDLLHFHTDLIHLPFFEPLSYKTITTIHSALDFDASSRIYARYKSFGLVAVSHAQRNFMPDANWLSTIHSGIETDKAVFSETCSSYLIFVGRLSPEKGPHTAIAISNLTGDHLKIAAKIDPENLGYFYDTIRPELASGNIEYIGEVSDPEKYKLMSGAAVLLMPISWPEPFGLVMIEAMACGTPVVAFDCGSVREIIEEGVNGYIVSSIDEAASAVHAAKSLDRHRIRESVCERFGSVRMAKSYLEIYEERLNARPR